MLETRSRVGDPVLPGQLSDLRAEIGAGLKRAGAPLWLSESYALRSEFERLMHSGSNLAEKLALVESFALQRLRNMPFPVARFHIRQLIENVHEDLPPPAARMILDLDTRLPKTLTKRERQAWAQTVGWAQSSLGNSAGKRAALESAGIERDLCIASDTDDPNLLEQHFSNDDYPSELTTGQQEGAVMFEFGVATDGKIRAPRIVYAMPSGLFDELSRKGIATIRYTPATRNGKAYGCRGQLQSVIWRLEGMSDFTAPTMTPEEAGDIS